MRVKKENGRIKYKVSNLRAIELLREYIAVRREYIPNYNGRYRRGEWVASTQVEKYNQWSVSSRCKRDGMRWSKEGVAAIAAMEAASRNGEIEEWQAQNRLPSWSSLIAA